MFQARNVSHENTARFIGACVDCPLVFILTEYCPKGSLKDVLANEELQLDWNFRTSLVHDIVQVCTNRILRNCNMYAFKSFLALILFKKHSNSVAQ